MRKKAYKIKHFKAKYQRRRNFPFLKILLVILCLGVIFAGTYYLGGPLIDSLYEKITTPAASSDSSEVSSVPEKPSDKISDGCAKVFKITEDDLKNTAEYDKLVESLSGVKAVSVPLRTKETLYFTTDHELALKAKLINEINATELISKLKEKGIYVIGEFETFADSSSARMTYNTDLMSMAVRYQGGKGLRKIGDNEFFLSPASEMTKDYLSYLLADAAKTGVDEIILKGFYFLDVDKTMFSENDDALDKSAVLSDFYTSLQSEVSSIKISVEVEDTDLLSLNELKYGTGVQFENTVIKTDKISEELISFVKSLPEDSKTTRLGLSIPSGEDYSSIKDKLVYAIENNIGDKDGK